LSSQWSLSFQLSHQYPICIPRISHSCYMPRPPHPSKESVQVRGFLRIFVTSLFLRWEVVSPMPNPQVWGPPLVGCRRLLIQYIRSFPTYLEGVCSIRNLRTPHAVVTRDPPNLGQWC
jgi:hypothetical protein